MPAQVVDSFNVEGQEYHIEPILDPVPIENSQHAVMSGGVFADKSSVPVEGSTKNFTAGGAFDFFLKHTDKTEWAKFLLADKLWLNWEVPNVLTSNFTDYTILFILKKINGIWFCGLDRGPGGSGRYGGLWYSIDNAKTWQQCQSSSGSTADMTVVQALCLYYDDTLQLYIAGFHTAGLWWSEDGITWTQSNFTGGTPWHITRFGSKLCVGFNAGNIQYSENGKNWTVASTTVRPSQVNSIRIINGVCLMLGPSSGTGDTSSPVVWSEDGVTWTKSTGFDTETTVRQRDDGRVEQTGFYVLNNMIVLGTSTGVYTSTDNGKSWTKRLANTGVSSSYLLYNGKVFVCPTNGAGIQYSTNGIDWHQGSGITSTYYTYAVGVFNGVFSVLVADSSSSTTKKLYASLDNGLSWSEVTEGVTAELGHSNNIFRVDKLGAFVVSSTSFNYLCYTTDGVVWHKRVRNNVRCIALDDGVLITGPYGERMRVSNVEEQLTGLGLI